MATYTHTPPGTRPGVTATGCPAARPSRRELIAAAGFSALTAIAALAIAHPDAEAAEVLPGGPHPDAELLALADRFMTLQVRIDAINGRTDNATDAELDDIVGQQADLLEDMHPLVVITAAGHRARARVFVAWYGIDSKTESHSEIDHDRLWPILRDLIGGAA